MHCSLQRPRCAFRPLICAPLAITMLLMVAGAGQGSGWGQTPMETSKENTPAQLRANGMAAYSSKDYQLAAKLLQEAVGKGANDLNTLYNATCALALAGDKEKAFQFLDRAIRAGFRNTLQLTYDVDLNILHEDPRWEKMVAACGEQRAKWVQDHSDPRN